MSTTNVVWAGVSSEVDRNLSASPSDRFTEVDQKCCHYTRGGKLARVDCWPCPVVRAECVPGGKRPGSARQFFGTRRDIPHSAKRFLGSGGKHPHEIFVQLIRVRGVPILSRCITMPSKERVHKSGRVQWRSLSSCYGNGQPAVNCVKVFVPGGRRTTCLQPLYAPLAAHSEYHAPLRFFVPPQRTLLSTLQYNYQMLEVFYRITQKSNRSFS